MIHVQRRVRALLAMSAMMMVGCSSAAEQAQPPVLQALQGQGMTDIKAFDAGISLKGFAGVIGDQPMAVYVTPDGNAIVGMRVDTKGHRLDEKTVARLTIKPMTDRVMKELSEAAWVLDGKSDAPRIVYAFTDPNCPYCHDFWQAARPWVDAGKVQIRTLLVGVIREDSPNKAASILGAADPSAALTKNEKTFSQGGIEPAKSISSAIQSKLVQNQMLMLSLGFQGTPGIVSSGADGKLIKLSGLPQDGKLEGLLGPR
ncbi:thiol:disulfide interchange protein DsbG [Luteibacter sp.]|uniref:thiol:disulfide interchange protein DsbG n=1 Tax=Luteibacter sp. TaxID=1886636 RepID=UPI002F42CC51